MRAKDYTGWPALDDIITSNSDITQHTHLSYFDQSSRPRSNSYVIINIDGRPDGTAAAGVYNPSSNQVAHIRSSSIFNTLFFSYRHKFFSAPMAIQDRTHEFRSCVESIRNRSAVPPRTAEAKQRLLHSHSNGDAKSEFSRMASAIGKDISSTTIKLGKLAQRKCTVLLFTCVY